MRMEAWKVFEYCRDFVNADSAYERAERNFEKAPKEVHVWLVRKGPLKNGESHWEIYNGDQVHAWSKTGEEALAIAEAINESRGITKQTDFAPVAKARKPRTVKRKNVSKKAA